MINRDSVAGLLLLALAGLYYWATLAIPSSSLSDAVGADGLPRLLAVLLVVIAAALVVKGALARPVPEPAVADDDEGEDRAGLARVAGFVAIGVGYMIVAPWVGYLVGIALLVVAVALYEGERLSLKVLGVAAAGGVGFWLIFVRLLGVEQPFSRLLG